MKIAAVQAPEDRGDWSCLSFSRHLSSGDLDAAAACFARDACLLTQDSTAIHGRERIRPALAQLISSGTRIEVELSTVLAAGTVALARERWAIRADGPEGSPFEQACSPAIVLREAEGEWKVALAAPWGIPLGLEL